MARAKIGLETKLLMGRGRMEVAKKEAGRKEVKGKGLGT
jgi:hypothetical protein